MTGLTDEGSRGRGRKGLLVGALLGAGAALLVLVILPAETGWDPTGTGEMLGLTEIADPGNEELERGMARMENQQVLVLGDAAQPPEGGIEDLWEVELGPFESVEFKYTIAEGDRIAFAWEASDEVYYDLHAHPFEGGEELTEGYSVGEAASMQGSYIPAFTGIHGWFWENRSMDNVTLRLEASGPMSSSTIYQADAVAERPLEGASEEISGEVAGHRMQSDAEDPAQ